MQSQVRYIICFEFLGLNFFGSQKQPDKRTVQGEIEKALCTLIKDKINIIMSGRTDSKVSAKYQTAHFTTDKDIDDIEKFLYHLNCILPDDVKVFELRKSNPNFHAQKSAKYKHYRYKILNDHVASVFDNLYLFYPYHKLDIERLNQSLSYLVGHHDFSSFKSHSDNPYDDCIIYYAHAFKTRENGRDFILIDIIGNRFLYNMVRSIVGELLLIERKKLPPNTMEEVLKAKDRTKAGNVIDAHALSLEYVGYDDVDDYIKQQQKEGNLK